MPSQSASAPAGTVVLFGAAGDLAQRLLMPSIYNLVVAGLLDPQTHFLGLDHNDRDADGWRTEIGDALHRFTDANEGITFDQRAWSSLSERLDYVRFDFTNDADYAALAKRLESAGNALFYFAVAPHFFETIAAGLARAGCLKQNDGAFRRLVIEKPFGRDAASARELNAALRALADESQLYRIDHFLGKEAVQGIPALRFGNALFEPVLGRNAVTSVQISAAETVGVEERGSFYETTGALRDMIPNHLFSLLTMIAMEKPASLAAEDVRDAKTALLRCIAPVKPADAVRGQYGPGVAGGAPARGYRGEDNVASDSRTETYAALTAYVENDRWRGIPFYVRTGKRMTAHVTTIVLTLRAPDDLFGSADLPHVLAFGIDPQRGLLHRFVAKRPGVDVEVGPASAGFRYETTFDEPANVGYETLLYHALRGDATLFQRADMIEAEWTAVQPVIDAWSGATGEPDMYAAGTDGPASADDLLARNGDRWYAVAPLENVAKP